MRDPMVCPVCGGPKWPTNYACSEKCIDRLEIDHKNHTYTVLPEGGSK